MKAGLWQILVWAGLVLFFFWPLVLRIVRLFLRNRREDPPKLRRRPPANFKCPKCGQELSSDAKFCSRCGCSVDFIDV